MAEPSSSIPVGVYPYLTVKGGKAAIAFYGRAFGAVEEFSMPGQDGERLMHARLRINGDAVLLSDDFPEFQGRTETPPPQGFTIHLQVDDVEAWWKRAVDAGATIVMPLGDQFWGDRYGVVKDPFGHTWSMGAPVKK